MAGREFFAGRVPAVFARRTGSGRADRRAGIRFRRLRVDDYGSGTGESAANRRRSGSARTRSGLSAPVAQYPVGTRRALAPSRRAFAPQRLDRYGFGPAVTRSGTVASRSRYPQLADPDRRPVRASARSRGPGALGRAADRLCAERRLVDADGSGNRPPACRPARGSRRVAVRTLFQTEPLVARRSAGAARSSGAGPIPADDVP